MPAEMSMNRQDGPGVLDGVKVLDIGGIGPGPFATMMLADFGAEVIRLDPPALAGTPLNPVIDRGKRSIILDLKNPSDVQTARTIATHSHILVEGFRPGTAEKLGLGPSDLHRLNPALVYGRITGFGQDGPKAQKAGHDLGYIASTGLLNQLGRAEEAPAFPANLLGDFGGGGMLLVTGVLAGLTRARATGEGTVVDAAMIDGANLLWSMMHGFVGLGMWHNDARGRNLLDSGAPFYDVYPTADERYVSVACIEKPFFAEFVHRLGIVDMLPEPLETIDHWQPRHWPSLRQTIAQALGTKPLAEIVEIFADADACVEPVLSMSEAKNDPHNLSRGLLTTDDAGVDQPGPAPRFSPLHPDEGSDRRRDRQPESGGPMRTEVPPRRGIGADTAEVLAEFGS